MEARGWEDCSDLIDGTYRTGEGEDSEGEGGEGECAGGARGKDIIHLIRGGRALLCIAVWVLTPRTMGCSTTSAIAIVHFGRVGRL